jgi:hypothetical protein
VTCLILRASLWCRRKAARTSQNTLRIVEFVYKHSGDQPIAGGIDADVEPRSAEHIRILSYLGGASQRHARLMALERSLQGFGRQIQRGAQMQAGTPQVHRAIDPTARRHP